MDPPLHNSSRTIRPLGLHHRTHRTCHCGSGGCSGPDHAGGRSPQEVSGGTTSVIGIRHWETSPTAGVPLVPWALAMAPSDIAQAIAHVARKPIVRITHHLLTRPNADRVGWLLILTRSLFAGARVAAPGVLLGAGLDATGLRTGSALPAAAALRPTAATAGLSPAACTLRAAAAASALRPTAATAGLPPAACTLRAAAALRAPTRLRTGCRAAGARPGARAGTRLARRGCLSG